MDPLLGLALRNVEIQAQSAARAAKAGETAVAAAEFAQAAMALGLQIGHFRAVLGPRYPISKEASAIQQAAIRLTTTLSLAFPKHETPEPQEPEPTDHEVEHDGDDQSYSYDYTTDAD